MPALRHLSLMVTVAALAGGCAGERPALAPPVSVVGPTPSTVPATTTTSLPARLRVPAPTIVDASGPATGAGGPGPVDPAVETAVMAVVTGYVAAAMADPATGRPAEVDRLLTDSLRARLDPASRAVLVDEALPRLMSGRVDPPVIRLTTLTGPDGLTAAVVDLEAVLEGVTATGGRVRVTRRGALTLVPGPDGGLAIDAFAFEVVREVPA